MRKSFWRVIKKILTGIFISVFSLIVFFIIGEMAFRLAKEKSLYLKVTTGIERLRSPYLFDPNTSWQLRSSKNNEFDVTVKINDLGFRGEDFELEKEEGSLRIFMVGDSFTYGVGAENDQTIPYLTQHILKAENIPAQVINAGRGHASTIGHYLKLRDIHLKYEPDIVLLLFDFSDLQDDWRDQKHLVRDKAGKVIYIDPAVTDGKKDWWFLAKRHSKFCQYIDKKIVRTINKMRVLGFTNYIKAKIQGKKAKSVIVNLEKDQAGIDTIEYDHYLFMRGRDKLPLIQEHWQLTQEYLLKIRDLLEENNIDLILVIYPYGIHVGPDQWDQGRVYWGFEKGKVYTDRYAFELIEDFARRHGIACINTLEGFIENKEKQLFFPFDGHLTPEGNEVMADSIVDSPVFRDILSRHVSKEEPIR